LDISSGGRSNGAEKVEKRSLKLILLVAAMGLATTGAAVHGAKQVEGEITVEPPQVVSLAKQARHARRMRAEQPPVVLQERTLKTPAPSKKRQLSRVIRRQV
jgi:hypothetical protein